MSRTDALYYFDKIPPPTYTGGWVGGWLGGWVVGRLESNAKLNSRSN